MEKKKARVLNSLFLALSLGPMNLIQRGIMLIRLIPFPLGMR